MKADKLLTPGAAGPFHIGMKVDDIKSRIRQEKIKLVDMDLEGFFSPAVVISSGLLAELIMNNRNEWVIDRLFIYDPTYYTPEGIHIGSTFSEIKTKYPSSKVSEEEGEHVIDEGAGITFDLSDGPLTSSVVKSIMLFKKR